MKILQISTNWDQQIFVQFKVNFPRAQAAHVLAKLSPMFWILFFP